MDPSYNGFDTQAQQPPIMSSGTGDIILDTSGGVKKSKKGWIIGGILGVLVVVAIVVAVIVMTNREGVSGNEADLMQQYINYVINCDIDEEVGDIQDEDNYYYAGIEGMYCLSYQVDIATDDEFSNFDSTVSGFLEKMFDETEDEELTNLILEQQEMLKMFRMYRTIDFYNESSIVEMFVEGSFEQKKEELLSELAHLSDEYEYITTFKENVGLLLASVTEMSDVYETNGCRDQSAEGDFTCIVSSEDSQKWYSSFDEIEKLRDDLNSIITVALDYYANLMVQLEELINE